MALPGTLEEQSTHLPCPEHPACMGHEPLAPREQGFPLVSAWELCWEPWASMWDSRHGQTTQACPDPMLHSFIWGQLPLWDSISPLT